jgi:hypothetical protein
MIGGAQTAAAVVVLALTSIECAAQSPRQPAATMTFFVTSTGRGFGADYGGLAGADVHCQQLASTAGAERHTWRAYLSAPAALGQPAVNARDRIGKGPWFNFRGEMIADSVATLHREDNGITRDTALTERGTTIAPGRHDILTGSNVDGTLSTDAGDTTCRGWTSHDAGRAMLGHVNRYGGGVRPTSWNSAHLSRGCSQSDLRASLGDALLYCFAAD